MTDPTGRSFLSYRRSRADEAALLIAAQHDHGIPTWQDIHDLASAPTEEGLRTTLAAPSVANAVLFITPEVAGSPIIRDVEVAQIMRRHEADDGFFVVPLAAGGLDCASAATAASSRLTAQDLQHWNMHKVNGQPLSPDDAATVAQRVLVQRLQAIHRALPLREPLRIGLFVRQPPLVELGPALVLNWHPRFTGRHTHADAWQSQLLPALASIARAIGVHAPGRAVTAYGLPTLPAAIALGAAFLTVGNTRLAWRQMGRNRPDQLWSAPTARPPADTADFATRVSGKDAGARDLAVLVSVDHDVEPAFTATLPDLPSLRALVHVKANGQLPYQIASPDQADEIALTVLHGMTCVRREYGADGAVHLFMAAPTGLAVMVGQLLNTFGSVQTYEYVPSGPRYIPAALLHPSG